MASINEQIADHVTKELAEKTDKSYDELQEDIKQVVDESLETEHESDDTVVYELTALHSEAYSRKPSNVRLDLDIENVLLALGEAGTMASGDIIAIGSATAVLCAIIAHKAKISLTAEAGFVFGVAYQNRHDRWEIPKEELVDLVEKESKKIDDPIEISRDEVPQYLQELERARCIELTEDEDDEYVVLRERYEGVWEI